MSSEAAIRIVCVDDHPLFREGISTVIAHQKDMQLVGMAASGDEAISLVRESLPDVTLMDLRLPDMSGITAVSTIRREFPQSKIIMLTTFEGDVEVQRALAAGARGYLLKSSPLQDLISAIREVHAGRRHVPGPIAQQLAAQIGRDALSERETEVLRHLADGCRNKEIGELLSITEETVKAHVRKILEKLGAKDRTQAVSISIRRGIIQL